MVPSPSQELYYAEQLGHKSVSQTWDYIKNVVGQKERRDRLKGTQLFSDDE
jgi:hypothetical protein